MAAPSLAPAFDAASRRSLPRHPITVALDVTALRSGIPHTFPGRCCDLSEAGLGAIVAGELIAGQSVAIELRLPNVGPPVRARAQVRYQDRLRSGLQFVGLSAEQREKIRYWSSQNRTPIGPPIFPKIEAVAPTQPTITSETIAPENEKRASRFRVQRRRFFVLLALMAGIAAIGWLQWQKAWNELEAPSSLPVETNPGLPLRVSSKIMDRQIIYKVDPIYPDAARRAGMEGVVVLDVVIAPDGTVKSGRPVAGVDVLAQAAVDAVQRWKYKPYRVNGSAVEVETTFPVEFRLR